MIHSERIQLIKPDIDLATEINSAILESQQELEQYLGWVSEALNNPMANLQKAIENHENFTGELRYFIIDRVSSNIVGTIGLIIRDPEVPFFEIGYWVRTSQSGKGYVTEAVNLLQTYAFEEFHAKRLEIRMAGSNTKSRAVAQRCGFVFEAKLINERRLPDGALSDTLVYAKYAPV